MSCDFSFLSFRRLLDECGLAITCIYQSPLFVFHPLTVIIEFFNLNHQCQIKQCAICSVQAALLTLWTAIVQTILLSLGES